MTDEIKVYQMNECDWVAARSLEEAENFYLEYVGTPKDKATPETLKRDREEFLDEPYELTAEQMQRLQFRETDEDDMPTGDTHSFSLELGQRIADGEEFPCLFASTEY